MPPREGIYGLLAEFNTPGELVMRGGGARRGLSPHGLLHALSGGGSAEAMRLPASTIASPLVCLMGGIMGGLYHVQLETWVNMGVSAEHRGRPLYSWPAFVIPAYEWTILWAGLSAAFGMLALNGLAGSSYHPLFNAPNFRDGATTTSSFCAWRRTTRNSRWARPAARFLKRSAGLDCGGGILIARNRRRFGVSPAAACAAGAALACWPAAARTCRTSRSSFRSAAPRFLRMAARRGRRLRTRWRAASCTRTLLLHRPDDERQGGDDAMPFPARWRCCNAARSASTSIARPATRAWATARHDCAARLQAGGQLPHRRVRSRWATIFNVMTNGYGAMPDYARS
jgi:hypothetical protein